MTRAGFFSTCLPDVLADGSLPESLAAELNLFLPPFFSASFFLFPVGDDSNSPRKLRSANAITPASFSYLKNSLTKIVSLP
jgi:hypothetical protein